MIALLAGVARAYDGVPQWDDPITDRAPREQTISLAEGLVIGDTGLASTRLQVGLTPYSADRSGFGLLLTGHLNTVWVPVEGRASTTLGGGEAALHAWFTGRKNHRTSHDVYGSVTGPLGTESWLVRVDDVARGIRLGYSGYYDFGPHVDVSFGGQVSLATPPGEMGTNVLGAANLTVYASADDERWVVLVGADVSRTTTAAVGGLRARVGSALEGGVAAVVPLHTADASEHEWPLWPVADLRVLF